MFKSLSVCGADIGEFSFYSVPENKSYVDVKHKFDVTAKKINDKIVNLTGKELTVAEEMKDGGHYIVISANSTVVNPYSLVFENGNVYLTGSYLSVDKAAEEFLELASAKDSLCEADGREGSLGFTVPYTKEQLRELFLEAYERDDMIITGTHTWGTGIGRVGNGSDLGDTADRFTARGCPVSAILEIDVGCTYSPYIEEHKGVDYFLQYDCSKLISEAAEHVSKGGIVGVCMHLSNPLDNGRCNIVYKGIINGDKGVEKLIDEGSEMNKEFFKSFESTLKVLRALRDNGIPFLFRPFHELNADWFWWCVCQWGKNMSKEAMSKLWRYVYKVVTVDNGIKDALWVYAPAVGGTSGSKIKEDVLYPYPGDDVVDIVGEDWYTSGNHEYNRDESWDKLMSTGKPVGLCEYDPTHAMRDAEGRCSYTCRDFMADFKYMLENGHKICYFSTWTWSRSLSQLKYLDEFMADPMVIHRDRLAERWKKK